MIFHIKALARIDADATENARKGGIEVEVDFAVVGNVGTAGRSALSRVIENFVFSASQIPGGSVSEKHALPSLGQDVGLFKSAVVYEVFQFSLLRREQFAVSYGQPRMHANKLFSPDKIRQGFQRVDNIPIEQSAVRKITSEFFKHVYVVLRLSHKAVIISDKLVFVITGNAIHVRHGQQKFCQLNAVRALLYHIAGNKQPVSARKTYPVHKAAEKVVTAVHVRNTIIHICIIKPFTIKINT